MRRTATPPPPARPRAVLLMMALAAALATCRSTAPADRTDAAAPAGPAIAATAAAAIPPAQAQAIAESTARARHALEKEAARAVVQASAPPPPPTADAVMQRAFVAAAPATAGHMTFAATEPANTERYENRDDNPVQRTGEQPVSTFSIDVDTGSYANVRRMLREGVRPPACRRSSAARISSWRSPGVGGSTNGGDGIALAYATARQAFVDGGVNRILLATDGDFNVGTVDRGALETLVADQRRSGIALSTLGFGQGNYHDAMAERLADAGDGNHAYIDTPEEARKVLVEQMQATLLTIANDVKVQIEFNPAQVAEYRLIGYENRMLAQEDFANDRVDAGDIGAGHEVTALYEIALAGSGGERLPPLRYAAAAQGSSARDGELAHLRLRYKLPGQERSRLIETPVLRSALQPEPGASLRFAAAVAAYADLLRGGTNVEGWDWDDVAASARATLGEDRWSLRRELVELVESARQVTSAEPTAAAAIAAD